MLGPVGCHHLWPSVSMVSVLLVNCHLGIGAVQRVGLGGLASGASGITGFPSNDHILWQIPAVLDRSSRSPCQLRIPEMAIRDICHRRSWRYGTAAGNCADGAMGTPAVRGGEDPKGIAMSQRAAGSASAAVVFFEKVSKVYGNVRAVDSLSLGLRQGETVAFLGPNGAGKSTALDMLLALRKPTSDRILVIIKGRLLADGTPAEIKKRAGAKRLSFRPDQVDEPFLLGLHALVNLEIRRDLAQIQSAHSDPTPYVLLDAGYRPREIEVSSLGLEQAFLARPPGRLGVASHRGGNLPWHRDVRRASCRHQPPVHAGCGAAGHHVRVLPDGDPRRSLVPADLHPAEDRPGSAHLPDHQDRHRRHRHGNGVDHVDPNDPGLARGIHRPGRAGTQHGRDDLSRRGTGSHPIDTCRTDTPRWGGHGSMEKRCRAMR